MLAASSQDKVRSAVAIEEDERQYASGPSSLRELDEKFPNRPKNHSATLRFSELFQYLFNPLNDNKKPAGSGHARGGRSRVTKLSPHEQRRQIIKRWIANWRSKVGNDIYPAFRLIMPDKDRDRGVYGLKENAIGKLLVKILKIDKHSEDGHSLLKWKLPGGSNPHRTAGDFSGRCYEVLKKRQMRAEPGTMTIAQVNELLNRLAIASGESEILPVFEEFYALMNAEELMWLIRIILKEMKIGATERTFFDIWHPDAEALFNVSSSLRRVCWELFDPDVRIDSEKAAVTLMDCFQPQLAQFQVSSSFKKLVDKLHVSADDPEYWIEEKLDGERIQLHMVADSSVAGGKRFAFWSRKGKDYTYLYGSDLEDKKSALTKYLTKAFVDGVHSIVLDGEMITWDPDLDKIMPFGTLKTAARAEQNTTGNTGPRPLFRVFDILYLNGKDLTPYELRTRHLALNKSVVGAHRRLEIHTHEVATNVEAIEPLLRRVIAEAGEGLVLKNPRSVYRLNSRNDDWIKVKPEYLDEFGESLDCVVIGGYFGSGRRGGTLSSFLCGLRASARQVEQGEAHAEKCYSFFKVGGGFSTEDYSQIHHLTEGKWQQWDVSKPPAQYIDTGTDRPDMWIRPSESVVVEAKAASVTPSDQYATGFTLRFPRFRKLRTDKSWDQSLDVDQFALLRREVEAQQAEKTMQMEDRKRRATKRVKREVRVVGDEDEVSPLPVPQVPQEGPKMFEGLEFCVLSGAVKPRCSKAELEALIRLHGGKITQNANSPVANLVADKAVVKVASIIKAAQEGKGPTRTIIRPLWLTDCVAQNGGKGFPLPYERSHLLYASKEMEEIATLNTDPYGDSYFRDVVDSGQLKTLLDDTPLVKRECGTDEAWQVQNIFLNELFTDGGSIENFRGTLFRRCKMFLSLVDDDDTGRSGRSIASDQAAVARIRNYIRYCGGRTTDQLVDAEGVTHIVIVVPTSLRHAGYDDVEYQNSKELTVTRCNQHATRIREQISAWSPIPHVVSDEWVHDCFKESTLLDESRFSRVSSNHS